AAVAGGDADRAAAVAPRGQADQPAGHRRSRSTRGTAGGAAVLPRVVGDPVELGDAHVEAAELAGRGEAHGGDAATGAEAGDVVTVVVGDAILEHHRGTG